jgi:crotonobetainyl-CoA hydratase
MVDAPVLLERREHVVVITFNRPEASNAANAAVTALVAAALDEAAADPDIRAVVVTGAGDRAFCAGADLREASSDGALFSAGAARYGFAGIVRHPIDKPLIAAVNGAAMGGGMEVVLACDLAVAARRAVFALPEVRRGLIAGAGGAVRLAAQVPVKLAAELLLTGDRVDAPTAYRMGLVNRVVADDTVLDEALGLAARIAAGAPLAVQATKRMLRLAVGRVPDAEKDLWRLASAENERLIDSTDAKEGVRAFLERRAADWTGR